MCCYHTCNNVGNCCRHSLFLTCTHLNAVLWSGHASVSMSICDRCHLVFVDCTWADWAPHVFLYFEHHQCWLYHLTGQLCDELSHLRVLQRCIWLRDSGKQIQSFCIFKSCGGASNVHSLTACTLLCRWLETGTMVCHISATNMTTRLE